MKTYSTKHLYTKLYGHKAYAAWKKREDELNAMRDAHHCAGPRLAHLYEENLRALKASGECGEIAAMPESVQKAVRKPVRMYTELRGHSLAVKTRRGAVKFAHIYSANIVEASFDDGKLNVELENGATYAYAYANGRFSREVDSTVRPAPVGADIVKAA